MTTHVPPHLREFVLVEIDEGGATHTVLEDWEVVKHLSKHSRMTPDPWEDARMEMAERHWKPGEWMEWPCGWVFCVLKGGGPPR